MTDDQEMGRWIVTDEVAGGSSGCCDGAVMLLQKGRYQSDDGRSAHDACRLVWREGGELHARVPLHSELPAIDALFAVARSRGWR
jgi:hypothetical protein